MFRSKLAMTQTPHPSFKPQGPSQKSTAPRCLGSLQRTLANLENRTIINLQSSLKTIEEKIHIHWLAKCVTLYQTYFLWPYWETFTNVFTLNTLTSFTLKYLKNPSSIILAQLLLNFSANTGVGACLNSRFSPSQELNLEHIIPTTVLADRGLLSLVSV